jgi:hypothetical protein
LDLLDPFTSRRASSVKEGVVVDFVPFSYLLGLCQTNLLVEMQGLDLVGCEEGAHCPLDKGQPTKEVQHIQLFYHFLPALVVKLSCLPATVRSEHAYESIEQMHDEVKEVILLELLLHVVIIRFEEVPPIVISKE